MVGVDAFYDWFTTIELKSFQTLTLNPKTLRDLTKALEGVWIISKIKYLPQNGRGWGILLLIHNKWAKVFSNQLLSSSSK